MLVSLFAAVLTTRIVRAIAYGLFSVAFALFLSARGLPPTLIGVVLTVALLSGAGLAWATGSLVRRFGQRGTLVGAAALMVFAAVVLGGAHGLTIILLACLVGTLSAGGQEVGPFGPLEQQIVAEAGGADSAARRFAIYNLAGSFAAAVGALVAGVIALAAAPWVYAACGAVLLVVYALVIPKTTVVMAPKTATQRVDGPAVQPRSRPSSGVAEKLTLLFAVDALAGGFVVQSFLAYWLHMRYGVDQNILGPLFFGTNVLSGLSFLLAARAAATFGLLRTMVFTHLPSNVLLCLVPVMPSFGWAAVVLLARFALSQMDVPTRQAFTMYAVRPDERARAAGLTNAVRPAAAAIAPIFSGIAMQTAAVALPFFLAGGLKIAYDLTMFALFSRTKLIERD